MKTPRFLLPPVYLVFGIGLIAFLKYFYPLMEWDSETVAVPAYILLSAGLAMILLPFLAFMRAKTGVVPFSEAKQLVTGGLNRLTRNPMYLGMLLMLIAAVVKASCLSAFVVPLLFVWVIQKKFIEPEEQFLAEAFGAEYTAYCGRVKRWL